MKRVLSILAALLFPLVAAAQTPFSSASPTYPFSATSSPGSAVHIVPTTGYSCQQFLVSNTGSNGAWVAFGTSSSTAVTIPASPTSGNSVFIEAGTSRVLTAFNNAWVNATTGTSTTTLNVTCGNGVLAGVTGISGGGGTDTSVNIDQVAGAAVKTGHGTAAGALRVELPTDGTGVVGLNAGTQVIGHVINDSGSTTAVTGNVTAVQPTAANLNAQVQGPAAANALLSGNPIRNGGSDGTNIQDMSVVVGDTGQNGTVMAGARKEVSFTTATAQRIAVTDVSNYRYVSVQFTTQGGSSTSTFQSSNDNSTWANSTLMNTTASGSTIGSASATTVAMFHGPITGRYFSLNVTGIVSGTTAGVIEFFAVAPPAVITATAAQGGAASGAVDGNNSIKAGLVFNTTQPTVTNGQKVDAQGTNRGAVIVATGVDALNTTYAAAGTQITNSANGASTSNVVATLAGTGSKTTYISGFDVTCLAEATTAANTTITVGGLISGTETYEFTEATLAQSVKTRTFPQPVPASTTNTSIVVTLVGVTGGGTCSVNAEGFQL